MDANRRRVMKRILIGVTAFICLVWFIIILVFIILRNTKPQFVLHHIVSHGFNISPAGLLTSTQEITLYAHNRNRLIGIYLQEMVVSATYKTQQISSFTSLTRTYLGHKGIKTWTVFLYGNDDVPLGPTLNQSLVDDQKAGVLMLKVIVEGRVRWRVGDTVFGNYPLDVNCAVIITAHSSDFIDCLVDV